MGLKYCIAVYIMIWKKYLKQQSEKNIWNNNLKKYLEIVGDFNSEVKAVMLKDVLFVIVMACVC